MIKKILPFLLLFVVFQVVAQNNPISFETGEFGANWTWTVFENDTNPPLEIVPNPDMSGINTSATVAKFTALQAGAPFAGVESMHGSDIGTFTLDASNKIVKIMVWKSVISDVGIKFVTPSSASTGEFKVANTLVNQWEELVFDFTDKIGEPTSTGIDQIVIFPDFASRNSDEVIYFDTITFSDTTLGDSDVSQNKISVYPNPTSKDWLLSTNKPIESITVYNLFGQKIISLKPAISEVIIDANYLSTGVYFALVTSENSKKIIKLIKN